MAAGGTDPYERIVPYSRQANKLARALRECIENRLTQIRDLQPRQLFLPHQRHPHGQRITIALRSLPRLAIINKRGKDAAACTFWYIELMSDFGYLKLARQGEEHGDRPLYAAA